jgi:hypothetical protein
MINKLVALSVLLGSCLVAGRFGPSLFSVPEPAALVLFGFGLAVLATIVRRPQVTIARVRS